MRADSLEVRLDLTCLYDPPDEVEVLVLLVVPALLPAISVVGTRGPVGLTTLRHAIRRLSQGGGWVCELLHLK